MEIYKQNGLLQQINQHKFIFLTSNPKQSINYQAGQQLKIIQSIIKVFSSISNLNRRKVIKMGATCQNQFQNVPQSNPELSGGNYNRFEFSNYPNANANSIQYQRQIQRQRFATNSINLEHKAARPSTKNVSFGMIQTKIQNMKNTNASLKNMAAFNSKFAEHRANSMQFGSPSKIFGQSQANKQVLTLKKSQIDRQQLHSTTRPFHSPQTLQLRPATVAPAASVKPIRTPLDLSFYHSLSLPEFAYPPVPPAFQSQYQNLLTLEQQERNGVRYIGEWKDTRTVHGNGIMQTNVSKYIGQFRNGLKHFYGREIQSNQVYQGQFQNGRRKGKGKRYTRQAIQTGQFDQNLVDGFVQYNNGNRYEGKLLNNLYQGPGKFIDSASNLVYAGNFINGKLEGQGQIISTSSLSPFTVYSGNFKEGLKHGKGQFNWSRSQYYNGTYARGKKHGQGQLCTGNRLYRGNFANGKMDGRIQVEDKDKGLMSKKALIFQNGVRINDQESLMSEDNQMPREWRRQIIDKKQYTLPQKYYDESSSLPPPRFEFNNNYNAQPGPIPISSSSSIYQNNIPSSKIEFQNQNSQNIQPPVIPTMMPIISTNQPPIKNPNSMQNDLLNDLMLGNSNSMMGNNNANAAPNLDPIYNSNAFNPNTAGNTSNISPDLNSFHSKNVPINTPMDLNQSANLADFKGLNSINSNTKAGDINNANKFMDNFISQQLKRTDSQVMGQSIKMNKNVTQNTNTAVPIVQIPTATVPIVTVPAANPGMVTNMVPSLGSIPSVQSPSKLNVQVPSSISNINNTSINNNNNIGMNYNTQLNPSNTVLPVTPSPTVNINAPYGSNNLGTNMNSNINSNNNMNVLNSNINSGINNTNSNMNIGNANPNPNLNPGSNWVPQINLNMGKNSNYFTNDNNMNINSNSKIGSNNNISQDIFKTFANTNQDAYKSPIL